ncbi:ABC transporter permease [Pontibacter sp. MBLB2868]|uniref:ABC transporter permease n=1 Tax=Pontibacter sp. MBLB2868 TaxID=3451555 RepID=UPI003F74EFB4
MKKQILALHAEFIKAKHTNTLWWTFIAFALAPVMGGAFIMIIQDPEAVAQGGGLVAKAKAMKMEATWTSYIDLMTQAVGVGGVLAFGFVASWLFGREYSDGTSKDLLSLPTTRTKILNAKFIVYAIWCFALVISNLLIGLLIGTILQLPTIESNILYTLITDYFVTTFLAILIGVPIAFFALLGKGYLAPLGFVALTLVLSQVIAAIGYGSYFPWSIPGLYSGAGGAYKNLLDKYSYSILIMTCVAGYLATVIYWKTADQTK